MDAPPTPGAPEHRDRAVGWASLDALRVTGLAAALYLALRLLWFANPLFLTAFLGILFGLAISSGVDRLEQLRVPRGVGAALIVITFIGLVVGFGAWVAPTLRRQGVELRRKVPEAVDRLDIWLDGHRGGLVGLMFRGLEPDARGDSTAASSRGADTTGTVDTTVTASSRLSARMGAEAGSLTKYLFPFLTSTLAAFAGVVLVIMMAIYIAADPDLYRRGIMQLFAYRYRNRTGEVLSAIAATLRKWLVTQLIAMLVMGTVTTIVLLVLGVKPAFALGVIAGVLEFVPTIGPLLSAIPAVAMGFLDSPEKALTVMVAFAGLHFLENHLLIPLLMKGGMDLPPALTVLSQALMTMLFGFLGLMCAVPLLAAVMVTVRMLYVEGVVGADAPALEEQPIPGHVIR